MTGSECRRPGPATGQKSSFPGAETCGSLSNLQILHAVVVGRPRYDQGDRGCSPDCRGKKKTRELTSVSTWLVPSTLHTLAHLRHQTILQGRCIYCFHFTDEIAETQSKLIPEIFIESLLCASTMLDTENRYSRKRHINPHTHGACILEGKTWKFLSSWGLCGGRSPLLDQ